MRNSVLMRTDGYKPSHWLQYPPNTTSMFAYLESRGGRYGSTVFFGLQYALQEFMAGDVVSHGDVEEAIAFYRNYGVPFNEVGWRRVVDIHGGMLPLRIRAVPEGTVVPTHNTLMTVESTDPELFWLVSWFETMLVRTCWFATTVATQSWHIKRVIREFLEETSDDPNGEIPFKLHDFGARGVSSAESAGIGGMAHLVNFMGSDTIEGVRFANHYYGAAMAGFSIPAAEHSTITSWGRHRELAAYRNMLDQFAKPNAIVAVVSDSYNLWAAIERLWCGELREQVEQSGATVVIRPDSGHPPTVVLKALQTLERQVGTTTNMKGFKVLPKCWRIIQGDGVDEDSIREILSTIRSHKYSASNVGFGMGGALLQKVDRDTQRFAYKTSSAIVDGVAVDVLKDPIDDPGKKSRGGRLDLVRENGTFKTVLESEALGRSELKLVFENGKLFNETTFAEVRARAAQGV